MDLLSELRAALEPLANPSRAASEKRYLKSELTFVGAGVPAVRKVAAALVKAHPELTRAQLEALALEAFATDVYELRSAAIAVLERRESLLGQKDLTWLLELVRASTTWAHVDWISPKVMGPILERSANKAAWLRRCAKDENVWVRRAALLAQLDELRVGQGDFELFAELAAPLLPEKDFWIRKATGWVLREVCKKRPELVVRFVKAHAGAMSGLTFREATRNLPPELQRDLGIRAR